MGKMKKKGTTGEVAQYINRNKAIRKLQLSLPDFRKLCILKGIYPREPKHRRKVQKGSTLIKTFFYKKDISFLYNEPIIWKIREQKHFHKKKNKVLHREGFKAAQKFGYHGRPFYKLDHIVRERYPTFVDALADLDDALTMTSLFSTLSRQHRLHPELVLFSKRLVTEFMHYVIEAKALRKVFISIKGYYYQAEIMGQTITWMTPHCYSPSIAYDVDMKIMNTFNELYITMLGFVNYRLYQSLNLYYPPRLEGGVTIDTPPDDVEDDKRYREITVINQRVEALNKPLLRSYVEEEYEDETLNEKLVDGTDLESLRKEEEIICRLKTLFKGMKFFLGRETNRESLTFVIRCCEGQVSWDKLFFPGGTYDEDDESITHQIIDRPNVNKKYLSRYYVQPQWVYDCINARMLLPVQEYFAGVELPPHLSPFVEISDHAYMPPEKVRLLAMQSGEIPEVLLPDEEESDEEEVSDDSEEEKEEDSDDDDSGEDDKVQEEPVDEEMEVEDEENEEEEEPDRLKNMAVKKGKSSTINPKKYKMQEEKLELRMRAFMVPKKHRRMYHKLRRKEGTQDRRKVKLAAKREVYEKEKKEQKKKNKNKV